MSTERHCGACGAIDADIWRERCDGCGELIPANMTGMRIQLQAKGDSNRSENSRTYCTTCEDKARAALPTWDCARCGHPRHMHNSGCLVLGEPLKGGGRQACVCVGFVVP